MQHIELINKRDKMLYNIHASAPFKVTLNELIGYKNVFGRTYGESLQDLEDFLNRTGLKHAHNVQLTITPDNVYHVYFEEGDPTCER